MSYSTTNLDRILWLEAAASEYFRFGRLMKTDILQLAKQGDAEAIAALMNHSLAAVGITIQAEVKAGCLIVSAVSASQAPNRTFLLERIYQGLHKLQPVGIRRTIVRGYAWQAATPDWIDGFDLPNVSPPWQTAASQRPPNHRWRIGQPSLPARMRSWFRRRRRASVSHHHQPSTAKTPWLSECPGWGWFAVMAFCLRLGLYLLAISGVVFFTFEMKFQATWLVEKHIYTIPAVGDFLRGIEMVEIANVLIFAILGMGIGVATVLLPKGFSAKLGMVLLSIAVPVVLVASPLVKYNFWIDNLVAAEAISSQQAQEIASSFLRQRVEADGVWGFYLYSAQFPAIPARVDRLQEMEELKVQIAGKVANIAQLELKQVSFLFKVCSWGIRGFYAVLAVIVAWFHFFKGLETIHWKPRSAS